MVELMNPRSLLVVLHDVAPPTWADYQPFVEAVDALGMVPMTWLVVPDFHKHNDLNAHPGFRRLLTDRVARGDELALHGYFHCDDAPSANNPRDWFMRRVYTHEGEFYSLSREAALARLHACSGALTGRWRVSSPQPG
jgi:predicted deacetylase